MDYNFMTNDELIRYAYNMNEIDNAIGQELLKRLGFADGLLDLWIGAFDDRDDEELISLAKHKPLGGYDLTALMEQANGRNT